MQDNLTNESEFGMMKERDQLDRALWLQIWRALWIVLDAVAKRWAFHFEGPLDKRMKD